jgi:NADH-quinone oxidoreductase subunit B
MNATPLVSLATVADPADSQRPDPGPLGRLRGVPGAPVILGTLEEVKSWARESSLWPLTFGLSCCAIEMMATAASRYDLDRFGVMFRATPRQADVLLVSGWVTAKIAPILRRLYDQMPEPKYVIAMGNCAIAGGPWRDCEAVVKGVDKIVPVDVCIPGCPPRPEALIDGIFRLQEEMRKESRRVWRRPAPD